MTYDILKDVPLADRDLLREAIIAAYKRVGREYNLKYAGIVESAMLTLWYRVTKVKAELGIDDTKEALKRVEH